MDKELIINKTKEHIKSKLISESTGHDWWHILRVYNLSKHIAEIEGADIFIVELASLLHDISDWKFNKGNGEIGATLAGEWLQTLQVEEYVINQVSEIIRTISFKGGTVDSTQKTIEGMAVQDADKIDALGAIGIARAFAYGGHKGSEIYNPEYKPQKYESFEQFKKSNSSTINHFYEKLLLLKDLMNTVTGKRIAQERHEFMLMYLKQFYSEWDGEM